jgi:hypothetical protein
MATGVSTNHVNHRKRGKRGAVIYYMSFAMVGLCGFCSVAVDYGRVQVVKTELRRAADASARAAVSALPDYSTGATLAVDYASKNTADGQPVALVASTDVEFGKWSNGTFTVLTGSARSSANAVRVTARRTTARGNATPLLFGKVIGAASCDASASAIAAIKQSPVMNVVGINGFTMNGNDHIDSYDSSKGSYDVQTAGSNVNVASNGNVSLTGSSDLDGNVFYGSGSAPASGSISGTVEKLDQALSYPLPTLPATYTSHGSVSLKGGQSITLSSGNHYFTSLSMGGKSSLKVTGPVNVYVQGAFSMDGNSAIATAGDKPSNLAIFVMSSSPVNLGNNNLYATVYAPLSAVTMNGNADLFGGIVGATIQMNGNNTIHYDVTLNGTPLPPRIVLVK